MPKYKHIQLPQQVVIVLCLPLALTENLLLPFNSQLNLRDAYNWNRDEVFFSPQHVLNPMLKIEIRSILFLKMSPIIMPTMRTRGQSGQAEEHQTKSLTAQVRSLVAQFKPLF